MSYSRTDSDSSDTPPGEFGVRETVNAATNVVITVLEQDPEVLRVLRNARTPREAATNFVRLLQSETFLRSCPDLLHNLAMCSLEQVDFVEAIRVIGCAHQLFGRRLADDGALRDSGSTDGDTGDCDDLCDCGDPGCPGCSCGMTCPLAPGHDFDHLYPAVSGDESRIALDSINALLVDLAFAYGERREHFRSLVSVRRARAILAHFARKRNSAAGDSVGSL